jgi:DNA polymerase delta subunit 2
MAHAAKVVRVIVAGNSLVKKAPSALPSNILCALPAPPSTTVKNSTLILADQQATEKNAKAGSATDLTLGARDLDTMLMQLSAAVPVDIMAGDTDPSQFMMPQQPLHRCLFPNSSRLKSLTAVTNPYEAVVEGASILGTSGQNVDDLWRYTKNEEMDRVTLLADTLHRRHMAPTAPETLASFPYKNEDPFILTETPHVYFAGNQPRFVEKLVQDESQGITARVIGVPSFAETSTIVLVNLRTLECEPVSFNLQ